MNFLWKELISFNSTQIEKIIYNRKKNEQKVKGHFTALKCWKRDI